MAEIITDHVHPPIPIRSFDWCAYFDSYGEDGPRGWGETEAAAIADLIEQTAEYPRRCKTGLVALNGDCQFCDAANGETCRTSPRDAT